MEFRKDFLFVFLYKTFFFCFVSYLSGSVQSLPNDKETSKPSKNEIETELPTNSANLVYASADLQDLVAKKKEL